MERMTLKHCILTVLFVIIISMSYIVYLSGDVKDQFHERYDISTKYRYVNFDKDKRDMFSFVHIQKTGGTTMEKHLVTNILDSGCECEKQNKPLCNCYRKGPREVWLICRYNKPNWPCGVHPDYATLKKCVPGFMIRNYGKHSRRYFYGTMLRQPVYRFFSEFRNRQRGASWRDAGTKCNGVLLTKQNPTCFKESELPDLKVENFLNCPYNYAFNRQTWMLSDVSKVGCNFSEIMSNKQKKEKLLNLAKKNINSIAFFGLLEYPAESQYLFEKTFNLKFNIPFQKWDTGFASEFLKNFSITAEVYTKVAQANELDQKLYKYAKNIFFGRYNYFLQVYGKPKYSKPEYKTKFDFPVHKLEKMHANLPQDKYNKRGKLRKTAKQKIFS